MEKKDLPEEFLDYIKSIDAKRAKTVIDHLLEHGSITTEELKDTYGYNHPPRAIRDVREYGIPIKTFRVTGSDGRKIAAYKFGNIDELNIFSKTNGRNILTSALKQKLIDKYGPRCFIYLEELPAAELQVDHRVPYEISGEAKDLDDEQYFMLLSASANRAKSWSCEHCDNWQIKDIEICSTCYWAFPENYNHIAMRDIRRIDLMWQGEEKYDYDELVTAANNSGIDVQAYIKKLLAKNNK